MMLQATIAGLISGSALIIGALLGRYLKLGNRLIAVVMAFGAGVLISALSIDLMHTAFQRSHSGVVIALSFLAGALVFVGGDWLIDTRGGHNRKRGHGAAMRQAGGAGSDSGLAILLGTLLDGIPESFVVGAAMASGGEMGWVFMAAVFLSNLPEGMSGTIGMRQAGMRTGALFAIWGATLLITILSSMAGFAFLGESSLWMRAAAMAFASGAILAMLCDTMIPEAFRQGGRGVALVSVLGFLTAFLLSEIQITSHP